LRVGDKKENRKDMLVRDRYISRKGEDHHKAKLKENDIIEIRKLRESGKTYKEISEIFKVHLSMIAYICNKKNWSHIC